MTKNKKTKIMKPIFFLGVLLLGISISNLGVATDQTTQYGEAENNEKTLSKGVLDRLKELEEDESRDCDGGGCTLITYDCELRDKTETTFGASVGKGNYNNGGNNSYFFGSNPSNGTNSDRKLNYSLQAQHKITQGRATVKVRVTRQVYKSITGTLANMHGENREVQESLTHSEQQIMSLFITISGDSGASCSGMIQ